MLLLIIIFTFLAVGGVWFSNYLKRQRRLSQSENRRQFDESPPFRSLFEPTDEELRAFEREEKAKLFAEQAEEARQSAEAKIFAAREYEIKWRDSSYQNGTGDLIKLAAESENAGVFSEISQTVIKHWRNNEIKNLSAANLAELLDSHLRLLPQQERTSGAIFRLKEEIAELLRPQSEDGF